jgi:glutamine amidotransferase
MRIAVVDYGMGNLRSVQKALEHVAPEAEVTLASTAEAITGSDAVVFPGQGSFADCMAALTAQALTDAVRWAAAHRPFLGICVGLQLLFDHSEEGDVAGLGILRGRVVRFPHSRAFETGHEHLKVPHMGWNTITLTRSHPVLPESETGKRFYFVHSYYVIPQEERVTLATCDYGVRFTCAVAHKHLIATQFHPEKSGENGLALLRRFITWAQTVSSIA